jgi:hypothetical protein
MVDGLRTLTQNRTKKPLAIVGQGGRSRNDLTMHNISLYGIVMIIPPVQWTNPNKNLMEKIE